MGDTYSGNFVVVWFDYTYLGDSTAETGEAPWSLIDTNGNTYSSSLIISDLVNVQGGDIARVEL